MAQFQVCNRLSGMILGVYEAESAKAAIDLCCQDAGYANDEHATEEVGGEGELIATEVAAA